MSLRPLQPQSPARIEWERRVEQDLCEILECSNSDAQDIMQSQADTLDAQWTLRALPIAAADAIDRASHPADHGTQPAADSYVGKPGVPTPHERSAGTVDVSAFLALRTRADGLGRAIVHLTASLAEAREQRDAMGVRLAAAHNAVQEYMGGLDEQARAPDGDDFNNLADSVLAALGTAL